MIRKLLVVCLLLFTTLFNYCSGQKRWDVDFSLIGRKDFLYSKDNQNGLGTNYKFISPIKPHAEIECSYKLNTKISLQAGIGLGMSGNGVKFMKQEELMDITQQVSANLIYLKIIPLRIKYFISDRLAFSMGIAINYYTDDERAYSTSYSSQEPFSFEYSVNAPFVSDYKALSCEVTAYYHLFKRFNARITSGIDFSNKSPVIAVQDIVGQNSSKEIYNYQGQAKTFYIGVGITYHLLTFGNKFKLSSPYSCPTF